MLWNTNLVWSPISWHTTPKILGLFKVINVFLCTKELTSGWLPLGGFRMGLVIRVTTAGLEDWDFQSQSPPPVSGKEKVAAD